MGICILDNGILIFLDGNRVAVQSAGAGFFTKRRAYSRSKFGEAVCEHKPACSLVHTVGVDKIVPLGAEVVEGAARYHSVVQRLAVLAEGHAAVHTAGCLLLSVLHIEGSVELTVILYSFKGLKALVFCSFIL